MIQIRERQEKEKKKGLDTLLSDTVVVYNLITSTNLPLKDGGIGQVRKNKSYHQ